MKDFGWSPGQPGVLAYWTEESGEIPARVGVMRLPQKVDARSKNLFNVASATLHWQESGDHLAVQVPSFPSPFSPLPFSTSRMVQVERYSKKKQKKEGSTGPEYSGLTYTVEVFRMREKEIPVDTLEIKEKILAFGWEPNGNRFCVLSSNSGNKVNVEFFRVQKVHLSTRVLRRTKEGRWD